MKYVRQLLIILFVSFFGELLKYIIPLSIPASIYGMVLLFLALELKILKVSDIKETSNFLIEIMPLMFVPAGVGLLYSTEGHIPYDCIFFRQSFQSPQVHDPD